MSAIFGLYRLNQKPVAHRDLDSMSDILAHRGTDGAHTWVERNVGLGHRMLWTTAESLTERLPLVENSSGLAITADARIDNRQELYALLDISQPLAETSDSELILAAYAKWGEQCPEKLLGDFAFAIWDDQKQSLFCARDYFGIKPFYYYRSSGTFAFASEIKALLCLPDVIPRLNDLRIVDYLSIQFEDKEMTFYEDILRLPPGHLMTISQQGRQVCPYWSLDPQHELRLGSNKEYAEGFRELFTKAVRSRMRSAFPVGSMLSGGLDSSSVTCVARDLNRTNGGIPLHTFSALFESVPECDESRYINAVLSQNSIRPHFLNADQVSPLTDLSEVLWHQDEPLWSFNLFLVWCLYQQARKDGVRVVLDGFDGDTTVSHGIDHLAVLAGEGRWLKLFDGVKGYSKTFHRKPWPTYWAYLERFKFKPLISNYQALRFSRRAWRGLKWRAGVRKTASNSSNWLSALNPRFLDRTGLIERNKVQHKMRYSLPASEREGHFRTLNWGVMPYATEVLDRTAAAFSIDVRYPFFDRPLVEYCLSLPPEQKIDRGYTRMVLRRAMEGILPPEIQWRVDKSNLGPNFSRVLRTFESARLEDAIYNRPEIIEDYFDITVLREVYSRFVSQQADDDDLMTIWKALSLSLWLQHSHVAAAA